MHRLVGSVCAVALLSALALPALAQSQPCRIPDKRYGTSTQVGPADLPTTYRARTASYVGVELTLDGRKVSRVLAVTEAAIMRRDVLTFLSTEALIDEAGTARPGLAALRLEIRDTPDGAAGCHQPGRDTTTGFELTAPGGAGVISSLSEGPVVIIHPGFNAWETGNPVAPPQMAAALLQGGTVTGQSFVTLIRGMPTLGACQSAPIPGDAAMDASVARRDLPPIRFRPLGEVPPADMVASARALFEARAAGRCRFEPATLNGRGQVVYAGW